MWIKRIKINNFRNYKNQEINLNKNINIFYGDNAQGKTNVIESIFVCSIGKSFRTNKEKELINIKEQSADVQIDFEKFDRDESIKFCIGQKKNIFINEIKVKKLSELLGNLNTVIFTPDDLNILKGGPQNRRKFLDIMISQLRPKYTHIYSMYSKTIDERNNYLKKIKLENAKIDLLDIWDEQLIEYGNLIADYRFEFIEKIKNKIVNIHKEITENKEEIKIEYNSDCLKKEEYKNILLERRNLDIIKGYTTRGVHRDDFFVYLNNLPVNIYGSQGQHRTAMLSLKLSELKVIYDEINESPVLLLDDFMSELDNKRINNFLESIKDTQVIITCTEKLNFENKEKNKFFKVENGILYEER